MTRSKFLMILGIFIFSFNLASATTTITVYEDDFSEDPHWITDQPENFYWQASTSALFAHGENKPVSDSPTRYNRYFIKKTDLDPTQSFRLTADINFLNCNTNGVALFGLYADDLNAETVWHTKSEGTVNVIFPCLNNKTDYYSFNIVDKNKFNLGGGGSGGGSTFHLNKWYIIEIDYEVASGTLKVLTRDKETGDVLVELNRENVYFSPEMSNLGISLHPLGETGTILYAYRSRGTPEGLREGSSDFIIDNVSLTQTLPDPECCSSVLFLPGIMSSRLYENGQKRWEPNGENDVEQLYLDDNGKSVNNISVGDVIEEFAITNTAADLNLYKTFLTELEEKKTEGIIHDFVAYGYDWRLSLPEILEDGDLQSKLRTLAQDSRTGKVTIVAHSNGGLLAKELINEVGGEASDLIDQIVFVGVPQLGTPQAIGALLHGYHTGLPFDWLSFIMSPEKARDFARNSPMSYNLLPHQDYFNNPGVTPVPPLITFSDGGATELFRNSYGSEIDNITELQRFLNGEEGRSNPEYSDLKNPALVNSNLLQNSNDQTANIDSTWQPPDGIKIYQIAGVGEQTLAGIQYKEIEFCQKPSKILGSLYCKEKGQTLSYSPVRTLAGDETVIEPSAISMAETDDIERWWINLGKHNNWKEGNIDRTHKNLLEISNINSLIFENIIGTSTDYSYTYLSASRPALSQSDYLTATLHSPLALSYKESDGTVVDEQNPYGKEARYSRYGEVQLLDIFGGNTGSIQMTGEATGSFTLELEEQNSSGATSFVTYSAIPSSTSTLASIAVAGNSVQNTGPLKVDYEGDGIDDLTLEPKPGEIISVPTGSEEVIELSLSELVIVLRNYIEENISNRYIKIYLLRNLEILEKIDQQPNNIKTKYYSYFFNNSDLYKQIALRQIKNIEGILDRYQKWKILEDTTVSEIKSQLEKIKNKL